MLIGVSGKMGSGKTEFAKIAVGQFGFTKLAFGDEVKKEVVTWLTSTNFVDFNVENFYGNSEAKARTIIIPYDLMLPEMDGKFRNLTANANSLGYLISYRNLLQWWGTEYRRAQDENYWVENLFDNADPTIPTIIDDVRMTNEAHMIRVCGGLLVRINWPGASHTSDHKSETALDSYPFFNLTITKPLESSLEFCHSEYSDILSKILGVDYETTITRETA